MYHPGLVIVALGLAVGLLSGCAVRTQFQGCVIRCPDMTKDPDQIEAEGARDRTLAQVSRWAPLAPQEDAP